MTKTISTILLCCCIVVTNAQGFLKASGRNIVNGKGENVLLRGVGLGGWMLQEGYMLQLQGTNPQYSVRNRIQKLVGAEKTQAFYDTWLNNFITKADIDSMHRWGFNSVRLPMHYNLYTLPIEQEKDSMQQTWLSRGFALTDSLLRWCKANRMYLILDLHAAPGGQGNDFNIADRDSTKAALWQSDANKRKTIALWKKLAERYKDEPWIGAYDILNETNWGFEDARDLHGQKETVNAPLRQLFMDITQAIRSVDKKHLVIVEGNAWGNNYKGIFPLWDDNIAISFHKYWNNTDTKSIQNMLDTRIQQNAPIWVGETGENSNTWFADAVKLFEENNIGWCWWPLKKIGINNPLEVKMNPDYLSLVDFWNGRSTEMPSEARAYAGLMELANSTNVHSNKVHGDVVDALLRQPFDRTAIRFSPNRIGHKDSVIWAVNYDLGRNGIAYSDKDTGNYSGSSGRRGVGNRGGAYRNDGVDIFRETKQPDQYYVGSIEEGEWLQYTVSVDETARYRVSLLAAGTGEGSITVNIDGTPVLPEKAVSLTGATENWQSQLMGVVDVAKGVHVIRIYTGKGGFNFKGLVLAR
jgi:endoglucanase